MAALDMGHELSNVQLREVQPLDPILEFNTAGGLPALLVPPLPLLCPQAPASPLPLLAQVCQ